MILCTVFYNKTTSLKISLYLKYVFLRYSILITSFQMRLSLLRLDENMDIEISNFKKEQSDLIVVE